MSLICMPVDFRALDHAEGPDLGFTKFADPAVAAFDIREQPFWFVIAQGGGGDVQQFGHLANRKRHTSLIEKERSGSPLT